MTAGRTIASLTAAVAVAGCVAVAVSMSTASHGGPDAAGVRGPSVAGSHSYPAAAPPTRTSAPLASTSAADTPQRVPASPTRPAAGTATSAATTALSARDASATSTASAALRAMAVPAKTVPPRTVPPTTVPPTTVPAKSAEPAAKTAPKKGIALPLKYTTGNATRVITVRAVSRSRTTAHLQAWTKAPGGGWLKYGKGVTAHIGADGMTTAPSESKSATPMGSFTLTQAFGRLADPGTPLPYLRTTPADWWISQAGPLYNTHQRCSSHCAFTRGAPNEHLYYETPYYNYAVVIDYNTRNAPGGVRQGKGSAFFLHVTDGNPTAGCVSIPQAKLVTLMKWLRPKTHPRILIGTL